MVGDIVENDVTLQAVRQAAVFDDVTSYLLTPSD